ncbi:MAG TPA: cell division protein ZipA C-terminal FtsZ-binding domain-containing protein [Gallionella sp.]|nr:cell division protein ZipA C-terminal FtsZ-binding domain-containing protein [Gallionella sp.]
MSELQAALLAIGFGVIVAVYAFGWWQQRKYRRKFGSAFKAGHADALYQESAVKAAAAPVEHVVTEIEPEVSEAPSVEEAAPEVTEEVLSEEVQTEMPERTEELPAGEAPTVQPSAVQPSPAKTLDESCALLDARSDFIIELSLAEPSPAAVLDGLWQRKFDFGKPVQVCGLTLNAQHWERAIAESQTLYERFRIAVQLVDRGGAISAAKLGDFRDLVAGIAKHIKADVAVPDVHETHRHAIELDTFCAEVDQMVGINLVPPGERQLVGSRIAQAASMLGMSLEADGAFHALDAQGHSLFCLINHDSKPFQHHTLETFSTSGVTLLLDVPRVPHPAELFDRMLEMAREFARELQVNVVDDRRVVLSDGGLNLIRDQIAAVEAKMVEHGIAPGSAQARRLFS